MTDSLRCSRCGSPLVNASTGAVCPGCLLKLGLAGSDTGETIMAPDGSDAGMLASPAGNGEAATVLRVPTGTGDAPTVLGSTAPRGAARATDVGASSGSPGQRTPTQIGPYRLVKPLGEGGMGVVYLAEQSEPIRRTVALKLIKLGMDTHEVVARFEAERQALALMDHPNIASVLDAGATPDGRPYFVMEYAPGVPITDYCDAHRLDTRARLGLFLSVCSAIQHAHQKGIIHRDLKPSNVLVVEQDGAPVPKVIDFGIAKATDQRLSEKTMFTQHGMLIGTPEYMSPEQADPAGAGDIDTRSDIYSLGVLLYELLVGSVPFAPTRLREGGYTELIRIIREEEPPKPSTRLTTEATASELADRRHTRVPSLTQELRGDLDWITLRALEKDRTRRYPSVSEFAADLTRYLNNEPVVARPPSVSYRVQKFVRRNRVAVTAASLVLLAVVGGLVVSSVLYVRAEQNRQEAVAQKTEAVAQRDRADAATRSATAKAESEARQRALAEAATKAEAEAHAEAQVSLATAETNLYFNNIDLADKEITATNISHVDELLAGAPARLRNWEWNYLSRLSHMEAVVIPTKSRIVSLAVTPDGGRMITVDAASTVTTWDARSGRVLGTTQLQESGTLVMGGTMAAAGGGLSSDGRVFAANVGNGTAAQTLTVWDAATGRKLFTRPGTSMSAIATTVFVMSPDGTRLVTQTCALSGGLAAVLAAGPTGRGPQPQRQCQLSLLDARTGAALPAPLAAPGETLSTLAFSPDNQRLAIIVGGGKELRVLDADSGQTLSSVKMTGLEVATSAVFTPDGAAIASIIQGRGVRLWNAADGKELWFSTIDPSSAVTALAASPDQRTIVAAINDRTLRVLDRADGKMLDRFIGHTSSINVLAFAAGGGAVLSAGTDRTIRRWNLTTAPGPVQFGDPKDQLWDIALDPTRTSVWTTSGTGAIAAWDVATGRKRFDVVMPGRSGGPSAPPGAVGVGNAPPAASIAQFAGLGSRPPIAFSTDGTRAAVMPVSPAGGGSSGVTNRFELAVIDTATGRVVAQLLEPATPGGGRAATAGTAVAGGIAMRTATAVAVSPRGRFAAAAVNSMAAMQMANVLTPQAISGRVYLWDAGSGRVLWSANDGATALRFSPDNASLAVVGKGPDRHTVIVDCRTFRTRSLPGPDPIDMSATPIVVFNPGVAFSPDGRRMAGVTGRNVVTVWDTASGATLAALPERTSAITDMAFNPDGTRLVERTSDGALRVYDTGSGHQVATLRASSGPYSTKTLSLAASRYYGNVSSLAFSDAGSAVVVIDVTPGPTGARIMFRIWDGTPVKADGSPTRR